MDYKKASIKSDDFNESNDCTVKAVAIACDVAYSVAHKALALQGRQKRRGCTFFQVEKAVESLGYSLCRTDTTAKTATTLAKCGYLKRGYFMAFFRGHVAAVVNGHVEDWTNGRRHKILDVYKVSATATRKERRTLINSIMGL